MKLLLYCTKSKPLLWDNRSFKKYMEEKGIEEPSFITSNDMQTSFVADLLNGKIVAECDFEVEEIERVRKWNSTEDYDYEYETEKLNYDELLKKSCLYSNQLEDYLEFNGYAIHIKNLHIFDEPRDITQLVLINQIRKDLKGTQYNRVKVAPQNMCLVDYAIDCDYKENIFDSPYILISIKPEWVCKILNGEKTIEVRKKVLKEMMKDG